MSLQKGKIRMHNVLYGNPQVSKYVFRDNVMSEFIIVLILLIKFIIRAHAQIMHLKSITLSLHHDFISGRGDLHSGDLCGHRGTANA